MRRRLLLAGLAVIATATCLIAATGVVKTGDGETYEGDVTETQDQVTIRAHGVDTVLSRDRVASIDYMSYADRFEAALAALESDDVAGRVALAREAFDRHEYEAALKAVSAAVDINPLDRDARQLESTISAQVQLEAKKKKSTTGTATEAADAEPATRPTNLHRIHGLDDDQANRVRQLELSPNDSVHIQFRDNVRKRFVDSQPDMQYRAFASRTDVDQALTIIGHGTPDMVDDIRVRDNPFAVASFGKHIQTALVQGCASSNCHGGNQAGAFRLMSGPPDASTMITNFYLVTQYTQAVDNDSKGVFSPPTVPLVDRGSAKNSLLYQYALPRARAKFKHPVVRGWDGLFRNDDDRLAIALTDWMEKDLGRLKPEYDFTFTLGTRDVAQSSTTLQSTTAPTEMPATMPGDRP